MASSEATEWTELNGSTRTLYEKESEVNTFRLVVAYFCFRCAAISTIAVPWEAAEKRRTQF